MAPMGVVERRGAEADYRRLPEAPSRLVRKRLAPSADLAVGANGVGLRLYSRRRHLDPVHGTRGLRCSVVLETGEGTDGSRGDVAQLQDRSLGSPMVLALLRKRWSALEQFSVLSREL